MRSLFFSMSGHVGLWGGGVSLLVSIDAVHECPVYLVRQSACKKVMP